MTDNGWFKSSDQLPEENVSVLVFIPEEDNHVTTGMWDVSKKWVLLDDYRIPLSEVTFWRPIDYKLPENKEYKSRFVEMSGLYLIAQERTRQLTEEGFTPERDDKYMDDELSLAAACYAIPEQEREYIDTKEGGEIPGLWPWDEKWWKPEYDPHYEKLSSISGRIKELTKAGALIAADIDRLRRAEYEEGMRKAESDLEDL